MLGLLSVLFFGTFIRFLLIGNPGFVADIAFWKSWSLAAFDHGIVWSAHNTNINYPPGFIYILWLMGKIYSFLGNPFNYNDFWRENNFGFLFTAKSVAIVSDIIIAILIYWFFSQKEKLKRLGINLRNLEAQNPKHETNPTVLNSNDKKVSSFDIRISNLGNINLSLLLSSIFFLNPAVILDSALWGQVESFGILFTLIAIILLFYKKPLAATVFFTTGTLMKLQNIIFIPLYFIFIFRFFDLKTMVKSLAIAAGTFFLINLPFIWQNDMQQVLYLLTINSDWFPWLSLNAHNLWWIVTKAAGMQITDKITVLGILNAKTVGLFLFSAFYLLSSILVFLKPTPRNFLLALTLSIFAFFLFTTQSHERYSYPIIVLLLFLYPFLKTYYGENSKHEVQNSTQIKITNFDIRISNLQLYFWILYGLLTLTIFFNIHTGLILNYPRNGFYPLTQLTTPAATILNSYILIILFFLLLPFVFSQISFFFFVVCSLFFVLSLTLLHASYLGRGVVSLTSFKPIYMKQDYGTLQINKAVKSNLSWKTWERLSDDYFYYRKGFGTHANSELVFDINMMFSRFSTDYGIDTGAGTAGTAIFKIYGDDKLLFTSTKMGRFDFPKHAKVDIKGVKYLKLVVEDAKDSINSDHADWFNPTLYK